MGISTNTGSQKLRSRTKYSYLPEFIYQAISVTTASSIPGSYKRPLLVNDANMSYNMGAKSGNKV